MGTRRVAAGCLNSRRPQGSMASDDEVEKVQDEIDDLDLGMDKKKKKSKKPKDDDDDAPSKSGGGSGPNEMGPNEFYPYAEILQRVYDAISEKNPELLGAKKFTMIPPQVAREGGQVNYDRAKSPWLAGGVRVVGEVNIIYQDQLSGLRHR